MRTNGTNILMFGEGQFRNSDVFLAMIPTESFLSGDQTIYFSGVTNGQPRWSSQESAAVPVVQDNPTNGPAWPHDSPSVGNLAVVYSSELDLWLMTYDGGRNTTGTNLYEGVYFCYAAAPWGPWSTPQIDLQRQARPRLGEFHLQQELPSHRARWPNHRSKQE